LARGGSVSRWQRSVLLGLCAVVLAAYATSCAGEEVSTSTSPARVLLPASVDSGRDALWGFIDTSGKWAIEPQFQDALRFQEGLAPVRSGEEWGYVDQHGTFAVQPQFTEAGYFRDGLARVATGPAPDPDDQWFVRASGYGYIDKTGRMVIPAEWDDAGDFSEGLAPVMRGAACGFIDKTGRVVIPLTFDSVLPFSEGLALALTEGKWGYVGKGGRWAIPPQYTGMTPPGIPDESFMLGVGSFQSGLAPVSIDGRGSGFCYIDTAGMRAFGQVFDEAGEFKEGLAAVKVNESWGFVDTSGAFVIDPQFGSGPTTPDQYLRGFGGFHEGLAAVVLNGKAGYVDKTGKFAVQPLFTFGYAFSDGFAYVRTGATSTSRELEDAITRLLGPLAVIDPTGKVVYQTPVVSEDTTSVPR
jgi:hypothetical protein